MEKIALALVCLALPMGVFLQCFTESVFVLNLLIDTRLPQGFTQAGFTSIQPGITGADVLRAIPPPDHRLEEVSWRYGQDGLRLGAIMPGFRGRFKSPDSCSFGD